MHAKRAPGIAVLLAFLTIGGLPTGEPASATPIRGTTEPLGEAVEAATGPRVAGTLGLPPGTPWPPNGLAIIELADPTIPGGRRIAEQRIDLKDRQAPIPFELIVTPAPPDNTHPYELRVGILSDGGLVWTRDPIPVDPAVESPNLGLILLQRSDPIAFASELLCGEQHVRIGFLDDRMRLRIGDRTFDLRRAVAASGARYEAIGDPSTWFWSKGDRGTLEVEGTAYPECLPVTTGSTDFRASGNEPAWSLRLTDRRAELITDLGATRIDVGLTEPELLDDGRRYGQLLESVEFSIGLFDRPCVDSMSGMPYPTQVEIELDDRVLRGCGGDPATLLQGPEWLVDDIDGHGVVAGSEVRLGFGADGRLWGRAPCNGLLGDYALTGETLVIRPSVSNRMACPGDRMEQEQRFVDLLGRVRGFELDPEGGLRLVTAEGRRIQAHRD